jgi:hypothetical protein
MHQTMKIVLLGTVAALIATVQTVSAATAYDAMRVVGKAKGDAVLETITEVRGFRGTPQPGTWKISTKSTSYDVRAGKLGATSAGRPLQALNLSDLKLDSDGAHTVAEREAKKAKFAYDFADYSLRTGSKSTPVWEVRLIDEQRDATAILTIGADTGKIITSSGLKKEAGTPPVVKTPPAPPAPTDERPSDGPVKPRKNSEPQYVQDDPSNYDPADEPPPVVRRRTEPQERPERYERDYEEEESDDSQYEQGYQKVLDRVGKHMQMRGSQLRSWFDRNVRPGGSPTYRSNRDYDRSYEAPRRTTKPDPNATRYYRPAPGDRVRD